MFVIPEEIDPSNRTLIIRTSIKNIYGAECFPLPWLGQYFPPVTFNDDCNEMVVQRG